MRSVVALVAPPECNDVEGYTGLEQMYRGGVVLLLKWSHQWRWMPKLCPLPKRCAWAKRNTGAGYRAAPMR